MNRLSYELIVKFNNKTNNIIEELKRLMLIISSGATMIEISDSFNNNDKLIIKKKLDEYDVPYLNNNGFILIDGNKNSDEIFDVSSKTNLYVIIDNPNLSNIDKYKSLMIDGFRIDDSIIDDNINLSLNRIRNELHKVIFDPKDYELFIVDYDGTILDSMTMWRSFLKLYVESKGFIYTKEIDEEAKYISIYDTAVLLNNKFNMNLPVDAIIDEIDNFGFDIYLNQKLKNGALSFLNNAKKYGAVVLFSATPKALLNPSVNKNKTAIYYDDIISTSDLKISKEDNSGFGYLIDKLNINPKKTIIVEDSIKAIRSAKRLGLKVLAIEDINTYEIDEIRKTADFYCKIEKM